MDYWQFIPDPVKPIAEQARASYETLDELYPELLDACRRYQLGGPEALGSDEDRQLVALCITHVTCSIGVRKSLQMVAERN